MARYAKGGVIVAPAEPVDVGQEGFIGWIDALQATVTNHQSLSKQMW